MPCPYAQRESCVLASALRALRNSELAIAASILRRKRQQAPFISFFEDLRLSEEDMQMFLTEFNKSIKEHLPVREDIDCQTQLTNLDELHLLLDEVSGFSPK